MKTNWKAAIFDFDGTLADSMYVWSKVDEEFLHARGIPVTQEYTDAMRTMYFETAAAYTKETYGLLETPEEIMQIWLELAHREYAESVRFKPGAAALVRKLKDSGCLLAMATSNNPYLLRPCLANNQMEGVFDLICYTSEVGMNKDHPEIYLYTAEKLGVKPEDCVVFEDIIEGICSAKKAGMHTIAVYDPANEAFREELKETAEGFIESYREMLDEFPQ